MQFALAMLSAIVLVLAWQRYAPAGERGAFDLSLLLPGAPGLTPDFIPGATSNGSSGSEPVALPDGRQISIPWGGRLKSYVALGRRALGAYEAWKGAGVHGEFDVSDPSHVDDQELAKMIAQYGAIPAASDLGQLAINAGARPYKQRIRLFDGSSATVDVIQVGSRRGGADFPEGKTRSRRKNLTGYRLGTAAWVMRKLHAQQRLGRRLARVAMKLAPRKSKRGKFGKR